MGTKNEPGVFDCYEAALPDEPIFVLLARDRVAAETVRWWAACREQRLRETVESENATAAEVLVELDQISEARRCAEAMVAWRAANR